MSHFAIHSSLLIYFVVLAINNIIICQYLITMKFLYTSLTALGLSLVFKLGLDFVIKPTLPYFLPLGLYLLLLSSFHLSEYFVTAVTNPSTLSPSSFLIDNSLAYIVAISCSFIEYFIETYLFPDFKKLNSIAMIGFCMSLLGEMIRKTAMFTAGRNFSHVISSTKNPDHKLVTHGIYSIFRHPSYAGWFYWAIGTQILLLNPICVFIFFIMSYQFFRERIIYEELILVDFFKKDYENYRRRVRLWMPIWF